MNLYQFRKHLAVEIGNLPVEPDAATQSYAVTTAALARKILGYLNANNLTLPNALEPDTQSYKLRTVLDRIIHFKTLGPDAISFDYPGEPNLVTLYSDKHLRYKDHLYIRLTDYRDVIGRLATDDILVAHYLFRYTVTLLSRVVKTKEEPQSHKEETALVELRRSIFGYTLNAWNILLDLLDAGRVEIPASPIDCYEELFEEGRTKYSRFPTCREFVDGYQKIWRWDSFNPYRVEIEGCETYCMPLSEIEPKANRTIRAMLIPFNTLIRLFTDVLKQVDRPHSDPPPRTPERLTFYRIR